jgi:uridine nucleosidase
MPQKIIIDTDPGIDDTMAILFALRSLELEVIGLTTIFGNNTTELTTQNALRLLEMDGRPDIPVAQGASVPLVIPLGEVATRVHGLDGLGDAGFPAAQGKPLTISAAQFIVEQVLANPGQITLVPIGPLTNIALALRLEPRIVDLVKEVVIMGGSVSVPGNVTPLAEANIWHDPHAAEIVFNAGWKVTMVGLDVTTQITMDHAYLEDLYQVNSRATQIIEKIMPCYLRFFKSEVGLERIHTHDPSALIYLLRPDLFYTEDHALYVNCENRYMGHTVANWGNLWKEERPKVQICLKADAESVLALFKERCSRR